MMSLILPIISLLLASFSSLLATHYNQKVIIIIDEYDTPIQQGHLYHYYNEVVGFMRNLFSSALKKTMRI